MFLLSFSLLFLGNLLSFSQASLVRMALVFPFSFMWTSDEGCLRSVCSSAP
jgi:hypothetical protein